MPNEISGIEGFSDETNSSRDISMDGLDSSLETDYEGGERRENSAVEENERDDTKYSKSRKFSANKVIGGILVGAGLLSTRGSVVNANRNIDKEILNEKAPANSLLLDRNSLRINKEQHSFLDSNISSHFDKGRLVVDQIEEYESNLLVKDNYVEQEELKPQREQFWTEKLEPIEGNKVPFGDFVDVEVANCLDLTNWKDYELISTEDLEPTNFVPRLVSYIYYDEKGQSGVLSPRLYVIPMSKSMTTFDAELPVLEYSLNPDMLHSLAVSKMYTVSTPEGAEIVFGGPEDSDKNVFNGKFIVLMWVTTTRGERIDFMLPEDNPEETKLLIQRLSRYRERINLNFSLWPEKVILSPDSETKDFQELLNHYDPELLRFARKYNPIEIKRFVKIFEDEFFK